MSLHCRDLLPAICDRAKYDAGSRRCGSTPPLVARLSAGTTSVSGRPYRTASSNPVPKLSELSWFQIITAAIAAWGAGLSTFNYLAQRRRDRRMVKVEIHDPGDEGLFPPILQVVAVNKGY